MKAIEVGVGERERFEMLVQSQSNKNTRFEENKPALCNWNSMKSEKATPACRTDTEKIGILTG